jgi:hypothetical protein
MQKAQPDGRAPEGRVKKLEDSWEQGYCNMSLWRTFEKQKHIQSAICTEAKCMQVCTRIEFVIKVRVKQCVSELDCVR